MKQDQRKVWLERLEQWKASGKSGAAWAKERGIPAHVFCYWRRKLWGPTKKVKTFIELNEIPHQSGIVLEWQEIDLRLANDFDSATLKRFLQVLGSL